MSFNPGNDSLAGSSDVSLSNPSDQHVLSYQASTAKWTNRVVPAAVDATTSTKGVIILAGDLGGTASAPTVPGLSAKADATHNHTAADITSGSFSIARIPTGTTSTTVALGNHIHSDATTSTTGFMSAADKTKLDGVAANANNYVHPTGDGNLHVPATSTTNNGRVLKAGSTAGSISWGTLTATDVGAAAATHNHVATDLTSGTIDIARIPTGTTSTTVALGNHGHTGYASSTHTHGDATTSAAGFMSAADKTKLDGVAANANNYVHPTGDGNLHVPATSTTNNGRVLKAGSTAGSISWGTLTATDVGAAAASHSHAAGDITSGTIGTARLGSGTASSSTFLRGDGAWATPPASSSTFSPVQRTSGYTATNRDFAICDASAGGFTVTLPTATAGAEIRVLKIDSSANAVIVATTGNATLAGSVSFSVNQRWMSQDFAADGTNWYCV